MQITETKDFKIKNEEKIFKKSVRRRRRRRKETKERISIQSLVEKITELNEILPEIKHPIDKDSMKYLSSCILKL